ncbi:phosphodiester glycosidase family protein [Vallitalea guaymasensis]|uniref:phosphodiester glycosidase family protein n=1 Tax=Vallitalea guaymasensis TaxID=1185412 RepID=UPI00272A71BD|nr:phosphodiester glycosidase family protein [Vallitalea guaymasensis]
MYIADKNFIQGCFRRERYNGYQKIKQYQYIDVTADITTQNKYIKDEFAEKLYKKGLIRDIQYHEYIDELRDFFMFLPDMNEKTDAMIYNQVIRKRNRYFGQDCIGYIKEVISNSYTNISYGEINGIDQSDILNRLQDKNKNVYLVADNYTYVAQLITLIKKIKDKFKKVYIIAKEKDNITFIPTKQDIVQYIKTTKQDINIEDIAFVIDEDGDYGFNLGKLEVYSPNDILIGFGEWCLESFKELNIDSFVCSRSEKLMTRALTNALREDELHFIYIHKGYNIFNYVSMVEKTELNYKMLSWIYDSIGMEAYKKDIDTLFEKFPNVFFNSNSHEIIELQDINKLKKEEQNDIYNKEEIRQQKIKKHIGNNFKGVHLNDYLFKDRWSNDVKVNYIEIDNKKDINVRINTFTSAVDPRGFFKRQKEGNYIASNFLFFITPKTIELYNTLRDSREKERINKYGWHIDYKYENNLKPVETFPLYNKAAIGKKKNGGIEFFRKQLSAGKIILNGTEIQWDYEDINANDQRDIIIYTPMGEDKNEVDYNSYTKIVGENRVNIICVDDFVVTIRKGDVVLPNIGVVVSLSQEKWEKLFNEAIFDKDGYMDIKNISYQLCLKDSDKYEWCYGGGMFLIYEGKAFDDWTKLEKEFYQEGWLTRLSMQTQESEIHKIEKHPRTVIGVTSDNKFFIMVCSGRSKKSAGANYYELIEIAKDIFGDIEYLMNIDGGGSSFLAYITQNELFELNDIAHSNNTCAGIIRPVNSIMAIDLNAGLQPS